MFKINQLFVKGQQAANIAASLLLVFATLLVAITALYGFGFAITWAVMLFENPATLHAPATFNGEWLPSSILAWQPAATMALWTLPIKLQGLIMVFIGAAGFYVASYAAEWLCIVLNLYPFNLTNGRNVVIGNGIALRSKWQPLINTTKAMWKKVISILRKVALYVMSTMATIAIVYFVWNTFAANCQM